MQVTPTTKKTEMKTQFGKPDALYYDSHILDILAAKSKEAAVTFTPELDLPVLLDSLQTQQGDPSLTHVKIIGIAGDWYMDAEPGDSSIELSIPSSDEKVLTFAFGTDAVAKYFVKVGDKLYQGTGVSLSFKKVTGTFAVLNKEHDQLLLISGAELFASAVYGNDNTLWGVKLTGSITSDGSAPNFIWLKDSDEQKAGAS